MPLAYRVGRDEVHRSRVYSPATCPVCGQVHQTPSGQHVYLYRYTYVPMGDRSLARTLPGLVCSDQCHVAHHKEDIHVS